MYIFELQMSLDHSPFDIVEFNGEYIKVGLLSHNTDGSRLYKFRATKLIYLVECIVAMCYGNQVEALGYLSNIQASKGSLFDTPSES